MATLHIFRHGETEWNLEGRLQGHQDSPLSPQGRQQAIEARCKIAAQAFDAAYCSTSQRALQTAQLLLDGAPTSIQQQDALREINLGIWEGQLHQDVKARYPSAYQSFWDSPSRYQPVGGESFAQLQARGLEAIRSIMAAHREQNILLVTHAGFIKTVLSHLDNQPLDTIWQDPYCHNLSHSILTINGRGQIVIDQFCDLPWDHPDPVAIDHAGTGS